MRYLLSILILSALLVACEDSPTASSANGVAYRWRLCSDTSDIQKTRGILFLNGDSVSIPKGSACTYFARDTSAEIVGWYGSAAWKMQIISGSAIIRGGAAMMILEQIGVFDSKTGLIIEDSAFYFKSSTGIRLVPVSGTPEVAN